MTLSWLIDDGTLQPHADGLTARDPLAYPDYPAALQAAAERAAKDEAVVAGQAQIDGHPVEVAAFDFSFMGGSMGEVAGERIARALERASEKRIPFVLYTATGGARMQEGMVSLAQMPKLVVARAALQRARVPFIAVLGNPTTGGVLASIAARADVTVAQTGATIGFAGPRLVERVTGRPPSPESHTAESARAHGLVDEVVTPEQTRAYVSHVLNVLAADEPMPVDEADREEGPPPEPDPWDAVCAARSPQRPHAPQLLQDAADAHVWLRGDRAGSDDPGAVVALARIAGRRAVAIALDRDRLPGPGAYRKATRAVDIATRLSLPVVTLVDTPGADPAEASEAGGIAWEIARLFETMLSAPVPTLSVVTGEGGSGGALAFAATDRLLMYGDAIFSVIGVESAAEILWRDAGRVPEAARLLKPTAPELARLGIADDVVPAPPSGASLRRAVAYHLDLLAAEDPVGRLEWRRNRWRGRVP